LGLAERISASDPFRADMIGEGGEISFFKKDGGDNPIGLKGNISPMNFPLHQLGERQVALFFVSFIQWVKEREAKYLIPGSWGSPPGDVIGKRRRGRGIFYFRNKGEQGVLAPVRGNEEDVDS